LLTAFLLDGRFGTTHANAAVEASELVLLATLSSTASTALADYGLMA
jgi:hypothetical protein